MPAGMTTMSAPLKACFRPSSLGRKPLTTCPDSASHYHAMCECAYRRGRDVREIGGHTGRVDHIVE